MIPRVDRYLRRMRALRKGELGFRAKSELVRVRAVTVSARRPSGQGAAVRSLGARRGCFESGMIEAS